MVFKVLEVVRRVREALGSREGLGEGRIAEEKGGKWEECIGIY